jgi:saccharopine dehydrogenase-like NADP-dependent oxidoreductase
VRREEKSWPADAPGICCAPNYSLKITERNRRAISWTTSASVAAVIEMVSHGDLSARGFLKQELIPLESFLVIRNGNLYEAV